jgi:hypothetical protein
MLVLQFNENGAVFSVLDKFMQGSGPPPSTPWAMNDRMALIWFSSRSL